MTMHRPVTEQDIRRAFGDEIDKAARDLLIITEAMKSVSALTEIPVHEIMGQSRKPLIVRARWLVWWKASQEGVIPSRIAGYFGVDHSSVAHALRKMDVIMNDERSSRTTA